MKVIPAIALAALLGGPVGAEELCFDFETGTLQGWRVTAGGFRKLLNKRVMFRNRRTQRFNKQGVWFLDTVEAGGDRQTGVVESPVFVLTGPEITLLVGGGAHADTYVALCTLDGREARRAQGANDEVFQKRRWTVPELVGRPVYVKIVDRHTTGWGHVLLDDLRARGRIDPAAGAERERRRAARAAEQRRLELLRVMDAKALRAAIADLTATFPDRYRVGPSLLERVADCEAERARLLEASAKGAGAIEALLERFRRLQREALVANPLVAGQPILFVARRQYAGDHHNTATLFQTGEINTRKFRGPGAIRTIDLAADGKVCTLWASETGVARDPDVHFDGTRVLFAMRRDKADDYHLYEMGADGAHLRQLTFAPGVSDVDPLYLPDGAIAFSSTREPKYCMCNRHIMANLHRMDADGANIHQIGKSTLFEGHGALTPDGRILYYRWEYVDRNFGDAQGLWTVNPDGTNHAVYWGNNTWSPGAVFDARVIPGSASAVCTFGSCHDRPWGAMAIVDRRRGVDGRQAVSRIWPAGAMGLVAADGAELGRRGYGFDLFKRVRPRYEDPWPLAEARTGRGAGRYFLVARTIADNSEKTGIWLVDVFGNEVLLHAEKLGCFDPMPLAARVRPPVVPSRRDFRSATGAFYVQNVYEGTSMARVKPGAVKFLRVVESPEKRAWTGPAWYGQGSISPAMNWHDFNNKRILGIAPVEPDGSAHFRVPADRFVFFQLLDADGLMVQSMRSGTMVQPGERTGCIGCHEPRRSTPLQRPGAPPTAFGRAPDKLAGWRGPARLFNYRVEVQPVFDRHCVRCHDFGKPAGGKLVLAGDRSETFCVSYNELWRKKLTGAIGAGPAPIQSAYSWGAHASRLVKTLRAAHHGVKLDPESFDRIVTWLDLNAPYYPSYSSAYPTGLTGRCPLGGKALARLGELTGVPFAQLTRYHRNRGSQISFDRPALSPCLKGLEPGSAAYAEALAIIRSGRDALSRRPRADAVAFTSCEIDRKRDAKHRRRREIEAANRLAIARGEKAYERP